MERVNGDQFIIFQGETPTLKFPVTMLGVPYDLSGGSAVLSYVKNNVVTNVNCTIQTTNVLAAFSHATTQAMLDTYPFQLMCKNSAGQIVMTKEGTIEVRFSHNPDAVAP